MMEQTANLRLTFDTSMRQVVEIALGILPTHSKSPNEVLDSSTGYIRAKRNVEFYMRLKSLAGPAQLCPTCMDEQMTTGIMTGIRNVATKQKLLALTPFPKAQATVDLCRSEESAPSIISRHSSSSKAVPGRRRVALPAATSLIEARYARPLAGIAIGVVSPATSVRYALLSWPGSRASSRRPRPAPLAHRTSTATS